MPKTTDRRSAALTMAVYTFLLALGAALPLAASYSEGIKNRHVETQIRGGAYQRRVQLSADASESVRVDTPDRAVHFDGAGAADDAFGSRRDGSRSAPNPATDSRGS